MPQNTSSGGPHIPSERETTLLTPFEEILFKSWARKSGIGDLDGDSHYDYRGFWKANGPVDYRWGQDHLPDTYKQHGHPTFSTESKYSRGNWDGGRWLGDVYIPQLATSRVPADDQFGDQLGSSLEELLIQREMDNTDAPYAPK